MYLKHVFVAIWRAQFSLECVGTGCFKSDHSHTFYIKDSIQAAPQTPRFNYRRTRQGLSLVSFDKVTFINLLFLLFQVFKKGPQLVQQQSKSEIWQTYLVGVDACFQIFWRTTKHVCSFVTLFSSKKNNLVFTKK